MLSGMKKSCKIQPLEADFFRTGFKIYDWSHLACGFAGQICSLNGRFLQSVLLLDDFRIILPKKLQKMSILWTFSVLILSIVQHLYIGNHAKSISDFGSTNPAIQSFQQVCLLVSRIISFWLRWHGNCDYYLRIQIVHLRRNKLCKKFTWFVKGVTVDGSEAGICKNIIYIIRANMNWILKVLRR